MKIIATMRSSRGIVGACLIAVGIGYLGNEMAWWSFTIFFPGWQSMLLILPALCGLWKYGISMFRLCLLLFGFYFLASSNHWMQGGMTFPIFISMICVCIGIRLLFTRRVFWYGYKKERYKD